MVGGVPVNEIYIMDADGTNVEKLASGAMDNTSPSWSPDGESIVYGGEGALGDEIRVVNADGTGERSITEPPTEGINPAWLPSRETERHRSHDRRTDPIYLPRTRAWSSTIP
jgi:TolB protein